LSNPPLENGRHDTWYPAELETVIMHPRLAALATLCREIAMPASVLVCLAALGSAGIDHTGASVAERAAPPAIDTTPAVQPLPIAFGAADVADVTRSMTEQPAKAAIKPDTAKPDTDKSESDPIVTAALTNSPEVALAEAPPRPADETKVASLEPGDVDHATGSHAADSDAASSSDVLDQCPPEDACIDRYLWGLYQRTPKEDAIRISEQRKVSVKRKGRMVTVTRTFTTVTDEDFSWKDPKAADKVGMPASDYVIGGIDRDFKAKLFQMLRAADKAGLSPGITSGFRDDYRQSIASGLKAANDRSYHGGSSHGGYGHGLAADIVSVNGTTRAQRLVASDMLWKWVDDHGKEFGIGRPYLDRDPPHVAPVDGKEYADHHPGMKARQERSAAKPHSVLASREHRGSAKRTRTAS
jgi:D-alanyl-D-alanine carboxypeptidase-like protein